MERRDPMTAATCAQTTAEATYASERDGLVRLAWLLTGSAADAEDAVHDAWASCATRLAVVDEPGAYFRRAVVNACMTQHRRRQARDRALRRVGAPEPAVPVHLVELRDALASLPERQRAAIVLRHYGGHDDEAIAEILGCRRATVRVLVHRGLARLREVLEP